MSIIRLGIVGCGGMATAHQVNMKDQFAEDVQVTATVDIDIARAKRMADALNCDTYVTDYRDIVDKVDAVLIALPHYLHYECGMYFFNSGKHVLMEKPLANTEDECLDLIHTAQRRNLVLMTAYVQRYNPVVLKLKEMLDKKELGDCFQISIWTEQYTRREDGSWMHRKDTLGGGQLFSHGCHYIDLLLWFLGDPVSGVHMGSNYGTEWMEKEGTSNVTMTFANGAMGYHFGTWGAKGSKLRYSIHAHCREGMIEADLVARKIYVHNNLRGEQYGKNQTELVFEDNSTGKNTNEENRHFFECVRTGKRPNTDGPESIQGLRVIWRLYDAEEKGIVADLRGLGLNRPWDRRGMDKNDCK
jgi:predicted dehydrogenase